MTEEDIFTDGSKSSTGTIPITHLLSPLQILGLFPYSFKAKHPSELTFSVRLFLWSVALVICSFIIPYLSHLMIATLERRMIGDTALVLSSYFLCVSQLMTTLILCLRSGKMAAIIRDSSHRLFKVYAKDKVGFPWRTTLVLLAIHMGIFFEVVYFAIRYTPHNEIIEAMFFSTILIFSMIREKAPLALFHQIFSSTANLILGSVTELVSDLSRQYKARQSCLWFEGSFERQQLGKDRNRAESDMRILHDLLRFRSLILQMQILRDDFTSYFFLPITLTLLACLVGLVCGSFAIVSQNFVSGGSFIMAAFSFAVIIYTCHVGHDFKVKVQKAITVLKTLDCRVADSSINNQISCILSSLDSLSKFDMCGWYDLDYKALVSCLSWVATYLVILLQIGWQTVNDFGGEKNHTGI